MRFELGAQSMEVIILSCCGEEKGERKSSDKPDRDPSKD
jgi:hypothetical protein